MKMISILYGPPELIGAHIYQIQCINVTQNNIEYYIRNGMGIQRYVLDTKTQSLPIPVTRIARPVIGYVNDLVLVKSGDQVVKGQIRLIRFEFPSHTSYFVHVSSYTFWCSGSELLPFN